MRIILIMVCGFLETTTVNAGEQTLFSGRMKHGGFGGPAVKISQVGGSNAIFIGGRSGWIINHSLTIGYGFGISTAVDAPGRTARYFGKDIDLHFRYGGLEIEYLWHSDNLFHCSLYSLIGGGSVGYSEKGGGFEKNDTVYVFEPAFNVELNATHWFRLNAGLGYRFIGDLELYGIDNDDLRGPSLQIAFKFGRF